jgi:hypothetical protein
MLNYMRELFNLILFILFSDTIIVAQPIKDVDHFSAIPKIAQRTLNGKLKTSDFENQVKYMVNVDTLKWSQELVSGDITYFSQKKKFVNRLNSLYTYFNKYKVSKFVEINDSPIYFPRKSHWIMDIDKYRIEWWFSKQSSTLLETITVIKF